MIVRKILITSILLLLFISCKNTNYHLDKYGLILQDEIIRIEYYKSENFLKTDKIPNCIVTDKSIILEIVNEINHSNNPGPWKGARWDKIKLVKNDTTLIFSTNGKVIGKNHSSGIFYELNDEEFIKRYFIN